MVIEKQKQKRELIPGSPRSIVSQIGQGNSSKHDINDD
jgi:hypothetical protein